MRGVVGREAPSAQAGLTGRQDRAVRGYACYAGKMLNN